LQKQNRDISAVNFGFASFFHQHVQLFSATKTSYQPSRLDAPKS